jgi:hypothetical protein
LIFIQFFQIVLALSDGRIKTNAFFSSSLTSTFNTFPGVNDLEIISLISQELFIMSIFSHDNSSITDFTLIHFCQIIVQAGSISS